MVKLRKSFSFSNLPIQSKLLTSYAAVFIFALALGSLFLYSSVRKALEANIESELRRSNLSILKMVQAAVDASIMNHLRAVAQTNEEIVRNYWQQAKNGTITEDEAKSLAAKALSSQSIGTTGYIYCVDSEGIMRVHPEKSLIGKNLSEYDFIHKQTQTKQGYVEYNWANPGDQEERPKALYMIYFGPWDWIISVSSYRQEFKELFSVDDIRDNILSMTFGQTGYPYVIDSGGTLIIHPKLEGENILGSTDSDGREFIRELCLRKNGKIIYPWKNPGEAKAREKLVYFNYLPELDWIVASSSYLEEFYRPLRAIKITVMLTFAAMIVLILPTTWWLGSSITRPLRKLMNSFAQGARGDYSARVAPTGRDETGQLATYFNDFMDRLEKSSHKLESSEREYRSIFENAVEGIFKSTPDGKFMAANPSMATMLGYNTPEQLVRDVEDIGTELYPEPDQRDTLVNAVRASGYVTEFETLLLRRDKTPIWVSINARGLFDGYGRLSGMEGFVTDITKRKEYEDTQVRAKVELEDRVRERTLELSGWVAELERRNQESSILREFGEMLQVCRRESETIPIVDSFMRRLFPDDSVVLYTPQPEDKSCMKAVVRIGESNGENHPVLIREQCWAMRQGKTYLHTEQSGNVPCEHVLDESGVAPGHGCACIPLSAQEELTGLLHITFGPADVPDDEAMAKVTSKHLQRKILLAESIAEHLALALANLKLRDTLRLQSIQDPLTGLFNRRYLEESLPGLDGRMRRHGTSIGILMMDLDHFKDINDTHGHDAGDAVLREFGEFLKASLRGEDIACRYGGEEFLVVLVGPSVDGAKTKARNLCREARGIAVKFKGKAISFTISAGVAVCPDHRVHISEAIQAADEALYRAKNNGRDRISVCDE